MNEASTIADGVYFSLSEDVYHAIPALSASGIKNLLISPMDFWARSWMAPKLDDDEDTAARIIGRAYHKRILEGKDAFYRSYAETFSAPANALRTIDDMAEALAKAAVHLPSKAKRPDFIAAVREHCPDELLFDDLREQHQTRHEGKEFLSADLIAKIEIAAAMIEQHPEISKCFRGGYPEVSVIWTESDIRFKTRFDYLKPKAITDLKTFANFMNKPVDAAIYSAMANGKYHIQAAFYLRAFAAARALSKPVDYRGDDQWLSRFADCDEPGFYFVFQQKGIAPLARCKKFTRGSLWSCGEVAIEEAIGRFRTYREKYGGLPWIDQTPIEDFDDSLFPAYTTDL